MSLGTNIKTLSVHLTYMKHSSVLEYSCLKLERPNKKSAGSRGVEFSSKQVCQVSHINHSPLPGLWNTDVSPSNLSQNIRPLWKQGNSYTALPFFSAHGLQLPQRRKRDCGTRTSMSSLKASCAWCCWLQHQSQSVQRTQLGHSVMQNTHLASRLPVEEEELHEFTRILAKQISKD